MSRGCLERVLRPEPHCCGAGRSRAIAAPSGYALAGAVLGLTASNASVTASSQSHQRVASASGAGRSSCSTRPIPTRRSRSGVARPRQHDASRSRCTTTAAEPRVREHVGDRRLAAAGLRLELGVVDTVADELVQAPDSSRGAGRVGCPWAAPPCRGGCRRRDRSHPSSGAGRRAARIAISGEVAVPTRRSRGRATRSGDRSSGRSEPRMERITSGSTWTAPGATAPSIRISTATALGSPDGLRPRPCRPSRRGALGLRLLPLHESVESRGILFSTAGYPWLYSAVSRTYPSPGRRHARTGHPRPWSAQSRRRSWPAHRRSKQRSRMLALGRPVPTSQSVAPPKPLRSPHAATLLAAPTLPGGARDHLQQHQRTCAFRPRWVVPSAWSVTESPDYSS